MSKARKRNAKPAPVRQVNVLIRLGRKVREYPVEFLIGVAVVGGLGLLATQTLFGWPL